MGKTLRNSIVFYITLFTIIAIFLNIAVLNICTNQVNAIQEKYTTSGERYYLTNEAGEQLGEGAIIGVTPRDVSDKDSQRIARLEILPSITMPILSTLCIIGAAVLFYHNKLKKPIEQLKQASEKIANNDLDFQIEYTSKDELGQLCQSFETMRLTLKENFAELWQQMEERKRLNAVFAHDLRTPLTVLKGYNEILQFNDDPTIHDTAVTMAKHLLRLEQYVDSMSHLYRLEDAKPQKGTLTNSFVNTLIESAKMLGEQNEKVVTIHNKIDNLPQAIDEAFISQVHQNLVSNAVRYAKTSLEITYEMQPEGFLLSVADDGDGFSQDSLQKATNPYFTEDNQHFGLGLYICKILCDHHGGYLKIKNQAVGAKITAFFHYL